MSISRPPSVHAPARAARLRAGPGLTFPRLIRLDLLRRPLRTLLTAVAVAVSVMAILTLTVITHSLQSSAAAVFSMGRADFIVAQKGSPTILDSVVTDAQVAAVARTAGVASAVGALVTTTRLDADHPQFLEIGLAPSALAPFGVRMVAGRPFTATALDEAMLGWQAAQDLGKRVGDTIRMGPTTYRVVGLYSLAQVSGDTASMLPLVSLQASEHKTGTVTLAAVRVADPKAIEKVRRSIEVENPNLATVRLASEFGRVDRDIAFLQAARTGATIVSLLIGVIVVSNTMLLSYIERIREFGLLRALGWTRSRLVSLVMGETVSICLIGAALGLGLAVLLTTVLARLSSLRGLLEPQYSASLFGLALYSAVGIGLVAALYPSVRAGALRPGAALRKE